MSNLVDQISSSARSGVRSDATKTVVIVEDNPLLRGQLVTTLEASSDIRCKYTVASGEEALDRIPKDPPDVVLMDIKLPGMSGIDCILPLKSRVPSLEILVLTIYEDTENIFQALKAGAMGYLIKSSGHEAILSAIRDIYVGGAPFSSHIARKVVQHFQKSTPSNPTALSPKETEVIELLASGYTYREIGESLSIGIETVRTHVKRICVKMQVDRPVEAVAKHFS